MRSDHKNKIVIVSTRSIWLFGGYCHLGLKKSFYHCWRGIAKSAKPFYSVMYRLFKIESLIR